MKPARARRLARPEARMPRSDHRAPWNPLGEATTASTDKPTLLARARLRASSGERQADLPTTGAASATPAARFRLRVRPADQETS